MSVETMRHMAVFSPDKFGQREVHVIGCGATGSRIALSVAKLGVEKIICYDFDVVEEHNIANQIYGNNDIGKKKVEALKQIILNQTGVEIKAVDAEVDGSQVLRDVVFILTDTMASREKIWKEALRYNFSVQLMIETRMDADNMQIYTVNPSDPDHVRRWEATLYPDEEAAESLCGAPVSVGPTAEIISGLAVWQMIRWVNDQAAGENSLVFQMRPETCVFAQSF